MLMTKFLPVVIYWRLLRIWLLVRVTGQWPLCLYWAEDNSDVLDACPFCEQNRFLLTILSLSAHTCQIHQLGSGPLIAEAFSMKGWKAH